MSQPTVTIFVRRRKIRRSGKLIDGFQAGFSLTGGVTCEDKDQAVAHMKKMAESGGCLVAEVRDLTNTVQPEAAKDPD